MTSKLLALITLASVSPIVSATMVSLGSYNTVKWHTTAPVFFDSSVEDENTPYSAVSFFDQSSMSLRDYQDNSGVDYKLWDWVFDAVGSVELAFGNYFLAAPIATLSIQVSHYAWNQPDEFGVRVSLQTYVNPDNPDSVMPFGWSVPMTTNGVDFQPLTDFAPKIFSGGDVWVSSIFTRTDPSDPFPFVNPLFLTEEWLRDSLWGELVPPSESGFSSFFGSYGEEVSPFGGAGGYAGQYDGGSTYYDYVAPVSVPDPRPVPDDASTLVLWGSSLGVLIVLGRRLRRKD